MTVITVVLLSITVLLDPGRVRSVVRDSTVYKVPIQGRVSLWSLGVSGTTLDPFTGLPPLVTPSCRYGRNLPPSFGVRVTSTVHLVRQNRGRPRIILTPRLGNGPHRPSVTQETVVSLRGQRRPVWSDSGRRTPTVTLLVRDLCKRTYER